MFILYPFLFATLYSWFNRKCPIRVGPSNPFDDMPAHFMPHVMSCISYEEGIPPVEEGQETPSPPAEAAAAIPIRKSWKQSVESMTKELPFRRIVRRYSHEGNDGRFVENAPEPDMEIISKNIEKQRMIAMLEDPGVPEHTKLAKWHLYDTSHEPYRLDLFSGGLMRDWDADGDMQ